MRGNASGTSLLGQKRVREAPFGATSSICSSMFDIDGSRLSRRMRGGASLAAATFAAGVLTPSTPPNVLAIGMRGFARMRDGAVSRRDLAMRTMESVGWSSSSSDGERITSSSPPNSPPPTGARTMPMAIALPKRRDASPNVWPCMLRCLASGSAYTSCPAPCRSNSAYTCESPGCTEHWARMREMKSSGLTSAYEPNPFVLSLATSAENPLGAVTTTEARSDWLLLTPRWSASARPVASDTPSADASPLSSPSSPPTSVGGSTMIRRAVPAHTRSM